MIEITIEEIEKFLLTTDFELKPGQGKVSFPKIQRIHKRLQNGNAFNPIKVIDESKIVDGHHRYICLRILGLPIYKVPAGRNIAEDEEFTWANIIVEAVDYDTEDDRAVYKQIYDKE